ncbi:MAG: formate/nitrite transporter family protein [Bacillota bacterium]
MAENAKPDAYTPVEIAKKIEQLGVTKANLPLHRMIILSTLAGVFVAMGGMFYFVAMADWKGSYGVGQVFGGLVFNLGLALIAIGGAELFTGNTLLTMAYASRKIDWRLMVRNWALVWFFNGVGALLMVGLAYWAQHWAGGGNLVGLKVLSVGATKASLPFELVLARGILANIFVTLAVWIYSAGRTVVDKLAAMVLPITAFVAVGAEHSIANMFFIPYAIWLKATPAMVATPGVPLEKLQYLTWGNFMGNLIPATLGNLIGGAICVGLVYWGAYLWEEQAESEPSRVERKAS